MGFSSPIFLFLFLPVVCSLYPILKKEARNGFLLLASLIFYLWSEQEYGLILLLVIAANYLGGLLIGLYPKRARIILFFSISLNVAMLAVFKYASFIIDNINNTLKTFGVAGIPMTPWHMPLGISFFTFMAISYLVDTYRGISPAQKNPFHLSIYLSLFSHVSAGPIVRYRDLNPQIQARSPNTEKIYWGIRRLILGLGKKVLIANTLGGVADQIFAIPALQLTAGLSWLGAICYGLQIYFDFSGYSDMAIGLAGLFGFSYPENFNYPYISQSIREFWSRWHISLSSWLRDYIFLPIAYSTSRKIKKDKILRIKAESWAYGIGILITMFLCGLWHGANWTFLLWGLFLGIFMVLEHLVLKKWFRPLPSGLRRLYTLLVLTMGWVIFRSPDPYHALIYLKSMVGFGTGNGLIFYPTLYLDPKILLVMFLGMLGSTPLFPLLKKQHEQIEKRLRGTAVALYRIFGTLATHLFLITLFILSAMGMASGTYNPFIYFRF